MVSASYLLSSHPYGSLLLSVDAALLAIVTGLVAKGDISIVHSPMLTRATSPEIPVLLRLIYWR